MIHLIENVNAISTFAAENDSNTHNSTHTGSVDGTFEYKKKKSD